MMRFTIAMWPLSETAPTRPRNTWPSFGGSGRSCGVSTGAGLGLILVIVHRRRASSSVEASLAHVSPRAVAGSTGAACARARRARPPADSAAASGGIRSTGAAQLRAVLELRARHHRRDVAGQASPSTSRCSRRRVASVADRFRLAGSALLLRGSARRPARATEAFRAARTRRRWRSPCRTSRRRSRRSRRVARDPRRLRRRRTRDACCRRAPENRCANGACDSFRASSGVRDRAEQRAFGGLAAAATSPARRAVLALRDAGAACASSRFARRTAPSPSSPEASSPSCVGPSSPSAASLSAALSLCGGCARQRLRLLRSAHLRAVDASLWEDDADAPIATGGSPLPKHVLGM